MEDALSALTRINLDDLVASFGWQDRPWLDAAARRLFHAPARKFARQMLSFDARVGQIGLGAAAGQVLQQYVSRLEITGREHLPAHGPLLVLANHPGMVDTLALFTAVQRADLRVIALERPFLQELAHTRELLFFVGADIQKRLQAVRKAAGHLRQGGAVLTFPAGQIEPDPAVYPGAEKALEAWTDSAGMLLRFAPQACIVPALVSGVLWDRAVRHPLTRLKSRQIERERLGAALQLLAHVVLAAAPLQPRVHFGRPIGAGTLGTTDSAAVHAAVLAEMRALLQAAFPEPLARTLIENQHKADTN